MGKKDLDNMSKILSEMYDPTDESILDDVATVFNIYGDIWENDDGSIEGNIDNFLRHDWHIDNESGYFIISQFMPTDEMDMSYGKEIIQHELARFTPMEFMDFVNKHNVDYS